MSSFHIDHSHEAHFPFILSKSSTREIFCNKTAVFKEFHCTYHQAAQNNAIFMCVHVQPLEISASYKTFLYFNESNIKANNKRFTKVCR